MNDKEIRIICATQRGMMKARRELAADHRAWERAIYEIADLYLDKPLTSEMCGYYAVMVQRWEELGKPDIFT